MAYFRIKYRDGGYDIVMHKTVGRYGTLDEAIAAMNGILVADERAAVRPMGNSKTVRMSKLLTEVGADIGDEVHVMIMTGVSE